MLCQNPYIKGGDAYPCGGCHPCLVRRREIWKHRILMENLCHANSAFLTLTYEDEKLRRSLVPDHLQLFLKRLRKAVSPQKLRYYAVGEYGERNEGAHYHAIIFGLASCVRGRTFITKERPVCCSQCSMVRDAWGYGHVFLGSVEPKSVGYVVEYVTKNMRRTDDARLCGRWPEFARMSLRPGLGYDALWEVADTIMRYGLDKKLADVPTGSRVGAHVKPYGRYLRKKLRGMIGRDEKAPEGSFNDEEMLALYEIAFNATPKGMKTKDYYKHLLIAAGEQTVLNMETRHNIRKAKRVL